MEQLERIKAAIWMDFLSGIHTYHGACDIFELLLIPKNALRKEKLK